MRLAFFILSVDLGLFCKYYWCDVVCCGLRLYNLGSIIGSRWLWAWQPHSPPSPLWGTVTQAQPELTIQHFMLGWTPRFTTAYASQAMLECKRGSRGRSPWATQRNLIYGGAGPGGLRCYMNNYAGLASLIMNDSTTISLQGIRAHRAYGPRCPIEIR